MMRRFLILLVVLTANYASSPTRIRSADYPDKAERITVLKKYLRMRSEVKDAQFDIYDVNLNAGSSIPGPTHRDFRIALAVKKADAKKWLSDVVITSFPKDSAWCQALIEGKDSFRLLHPKDFWTYTGKDKLVFHFEKDAVLCVRITQE
jgi:hypothetical protein